MIIKTMQPLEWLKRFKRGLDGYISYRKAFLIIIIFFLCLLYSGPSIFRWLFVNKLPHFDSNSRCIHDLIDHYVSYIDSADLSVRKDDQDELTENEYVPFLGNGKIGISIHGGEKTLLIKSKRLLNVPVPYSPIVSTEIEMFSTKEATVLHFASGLAYRFQCMALPTMSAYVQHTYYAHRTIPSILVQDITIRNPSENAINLQLKRLLGHRWLGSTKVSEKMDYTPDGISVTTGKVEDPENPNLIYAIAIATNKIPSSINANSDNSRYLHVVTSVHYEGPIDPRTYDSSILRVTKKAKQDLEYALSVPTTKLKGDHVSVWQQLWSSGFSISNSLLKGALNGDKINATIYYVLSHSPSPVHEVDVSKQQKEELVALLSNPDRCYQQGHHTLQAATLWSNLNDVESVNRVVGYWLLTLSKQGCQTMIGAGADGVLQAMILSFGGFKFANDHLEFLTHPSDLHRDYHFRRISYGNATHLNISVVVGEDNKAIIYVALDRSDRNYYACDAGCLDPPVLLGTDKKQFPVKLTNPVTSVLYITADREHMEVLKHTIHVSEVAEAPAHEHHVLALHRHGHHLGGLPPMFWATIIFLVVIFHLFLFKLIYNEYFTGNEKIHARYTL